ncbi:uncharacterized protein V6R79_013299 [Siganus canaliculatus]
MDDATGLNSSAQEVTNESIPSSLMDNLQAQMDDATGPNSSPQQVTNESIPSSLMDNPQPQMDDATGPNSSPQQLTNESIPSSLMDNLQPQMDDATGPNSSPQQLTNESIPSSLMDNLQPQMDDATGPNSSPQQVTNESIPSSLMDNLQPQMDDATGPNSSPQQVTNESIPSSLMDNPQPQMHDATGPNSSPQQLTNESIPSSLMDNLQPQMDDATGPNSSPQQVTNESIPSSLMDNLQAQMDDATGPNSSPQQILPDNQTDDEVVVPRLRRTKSVIIKTAHLEVSPDLYDSTSGSADEYIPDSTSESDSDSDVSLRIGSKPQSLREELDLDSFCDTTTPDIMTLERSHQDEEEEEPCSSQDINDNIVVEKILESDVEDMDMQDSSSATINEAVADDSLAPTERSTMLPAACKRQRTPSPQSDELSEKDCSSKPPSKGRGIQKKKTPWQQKEVQAVEKQMSRFITSCIVPNKSDCEKCLKAEPEALKHRDWRNLKFYVYNRIIAYKRKLQCA